jgi:hypothetical protein
VAVGVPPRLRVANGWSEEGEADASRSGEGEQQWSRRGRRHADPSRVPSICALGWSNRELSRTFFCLKQLSRKLYPTLTEVKCKLQSVHNCAFTKPNKRGTEHANDPKFTAPEFSGNTDRYSSGIVSSSTWPSSKSAPTSPWMEAHQSVRCGTQAATGRRQRGA